MHIRSLYLQQFRNYREVQLEFNPSLNLICGPNAQGKTSLLEALHYLMIGRSFRPARNLDLIHQGSSFFYVEALFCKHGVDQTLRIRVDANERKMVHNSSQLPAASNLLGLISGVVMTPDDVSLVKGSPPLRRQFLDLLIAQTDPLYVHYIARYGKAMRHRNQLLRQKKTASIDIWEHEMAQAAAYVVMQRRLGTEALQLHCQAFYTHLTNEAELLTLEYRTAASQCRDEHEIKAFHLQHFQKNRMREMTLGMTLTGPHKDDLWIGIGGRDVRFFASEGQQRSCVAALHLGEWQRLKEASTVTPLFMIDDVGISLDEKRKERLLGHLASLGQVFLTTTDSRLIDSFSGPKKIIALPLMLKET